MRFSHHLSSLPTIDTYFSTLQMRRTFSISAIKGKSEAIKCFVNHCYWVFCGVVRIFTENSTEFSSHIYTSRRWYVISRVDSSSQLVLEKNICLNSLFYICRLPIINFFFNKGLKDHLIAQICGHYFLLMVFKLELEVELLLTSSNFHHSKVT